MNACAGRNHACILNIVSRICKEGKVVGDFLHTRFQVNLNNFISFHLGTWDSVA